MYRLPSGVASTECEMDARLRFDHRQENLGGRGFFSAPLDDLVIRACSGSLDVHDFRTSVLRNRTDAGIDAQIRPRKIRSRTGASPAVKSSKKDDKWYLTLDETKDSLKNSAGFKYNKTTTSWEPDKR
jgi:hypothetical protein